jgi:integrase
MDSGTKIRISSVYCKNGNWHCYYYCPRTGKRKSVSLGCKSESEARKRANLIATGEIDILGNVKAPNPTLNEACEYFIAARNAGKGLADSTLVSYGLYSRHLFEFFGKACDVTTINLDAATKYMIARSDSGASSLTILHELTYLKAVLNHQHKLGVNVRLDIIPSSVKGAYKPRERFLLPKELRVLLPYLRDKNYTDYEYVLSYLLLGVRRRELFQILPKHIDFEELTIQLYCSKTKRWRINPVHPDLVPVLKDRCGGKNPDQPLFPTRWIQKDKIEVWCKSCGLEAFTIHDLRRSFGSLMIIQNQNLQIVSKLLGHSNIGTTAKTYAVTNGEAKRNAVGSIALN